jgi:reverse gyrase
MNDSLFGDDKEDDDPVKIDQITLNDNYGNTDEENKNEEMEELSDIMRQSDYDDDDYEETICKISDSDSIREYTKKGNSYYSSDNEDSEDYIIKRRKTTDLRRCCDGLNEEEPEFCIDIKEGFTQMVNKNIKKVINLPYYTNNEMIEVLMIAEKPSLAKTITRIISNNNYRSHYYEPIMIYTFQKLFQGKKAFYTVTSIRGHIYQDSFGYQVDYNNEVNKLYEEKIVKKLKYNDDDENDNRRKLNIPLFLRIIAKDKDILCLWLDCDPEGENICYEVIHNVYPNMNKRNYQQIYRAKFNSLTEKDIKLAFDNLSDYPNKKLSMSVDARSIIDFKVGVCFTSLFSSKILPYLEIIRDHFNIISYGPCQTPTLWFCLQRLKER